ncbi:glycine cleavage system protein R [Haliea sp. E17]|uniref:glycine cleavage system protein R n=1 Tax=Haliea sp. E17 TaxID=3401576 RepID=UPI003AADFC9A
MSKTYIITFIGDDRPGLVEQLSSTIERHGGNWQESQLSQLGGKFAGLILVSLAGADGTELEEALKGLAASGLSVRVTPCSGAVASTEGEHSIALSVLGPDRPGIVREISRALAQRQINVAEMESSVESAPMSGELLFRAAIRALVPADTDMGDLQDSLDTIANQMTLEIDLD